MREHNFAISKTRGAVDPTKDVWNCALCNSMVLFPKGMSKNMVNRHMANRLLCHEPMKDYDPSDDEGDTQLTYQLVKKETTFDRVMRERREGRKV